MLVKEIIICFEDDIELSNNARCDLDSAIDEILKKHGLTKDCLLYA